MKTRGPVPGCSMKLQVIGSLLGPRTASLARLFCLVSLLALCLQPAPACRAAEPSREYQLKAVFLFNFTQFVEWPKEAFSEADTPFVIGVLGTDPFGRILDEVVANETVQNRPLIVRRYARVQEIDSCHVLFIARSEAGRLRDILRALKGRPILTVSDIDRFLPEGGMIQLAAENKIRLRINPDTARAARVTISSKLLRLAEIVRNGRV